MVSEIKQPPLSKGLDLPLWYMYIVVQCGLSSIVEYGKTIYVVDYVKLSDLHVISGVLHILKNKSQTLTIGCIMFVLWHLALLSHDMYYVL
jgi:hypothetical protein